MEKYLLYINGEFRESSDGKTYDAINPANGEVIAKVSEATIEDTRAAIKSARDAFDSGVWSDMPGEERSRIIKQIVDKINENAKMLTKLEVMDSGSTIRKAGEDIFLSAKSMNYFSKMQHWKLCPYKVYFCNQHLILKMRSPLILPIL